MSIRWISDGSAGSAAEPSQPPHTTQGFMTRPTLLEEDGLVLGLTMESCHSSLGFGSQPAPGMLRGREGGGKQSCAGGPGTREPLAWTVEVLSSCLCLAVQVHCQVGEDPPRFPSPEQLGAHRGQGMSLEQEAGEVDGRREMKPLMGAAARDGEVSEVLCLGHLFPSAFPVLR